MANSSKNNEESRFFDAQEQINRESVFNCDYFPFVTSEEYAVWISAPQSVKERRNEFVRQMRLGLGEIEQENRVDICDNSRRIMENSGAVLRMSGDVFCSSRSSLSSWNKEDLDSSEFRNGNSNFRGESECTVYGIAETRQIEDNVNSPRETKNSKKNRWLDKLRSMACVTTVFEKDDVGPSGLDRVRRIRVRRSRRRSKEISALFTGLDFQAHEGAVIAMKFSHDGEYLASAGEDKIVKIWQVVEDERSNTNFDIPNLDPSCVYITANPSSESGPLKVERDEINKSKSSFDRTRPSTCVVFPSKVFKIVEKPLHVFEGHEGEISDLSWSTNNCLLSSSVDKTVRLWRVGVDRCITIFPHNDYVTSIQFNPVNDDHFISGSINGKVRIWAISDCKVVDWTETSDIITAVSYCPDGQSGIIGSITGSCCFFDLSDNHFQLEPQKCLISKKKSPCKRITAFQFLPQDPSKILVTCADSKVRIIDRMTVIGRYKGGLGNAGNQISASFTSNGKHIVSASDDSNIYIWNYTNQSKPPSLSKPKAIRSFECFSSGASIAIPWPGLKGEQSTNSRPFSPSDYFSLLRQEYFLGSTPKGSATWPEEKLPIPSPPQMHPKYPLSKSQYKLFKNSCRSSYESHAWGLVIVAAGLDGRIRSFHNYGLPVPL